MKEIQLTQNQVAIVDDADFEALNAYKWHARWNPSTKSFYAQRSVPIGGGKRTTIQMHRVITCAQKGFDVDHINKNTLDNSKANMRVCSRSENGRNRGKQIDNTSGYKGVDSKNGKWRARIGHLGKKKFLGFFDNILDAAAAYDKAAIELHGSYARHNGVAA